MNFDIDPRDINLQGPDGMQLVKLLRGLIEEIDSGGDVPVPVVDSEIFYCTYNQTSGAEISQALSNGLLPICKYNTKVYYLVSTVPPYAFVSFDRTNFNMYLLTCIGTTWSMPIRYLQERLEFDYTPTEGSTNPVTSGGVWTAIQHGGGGSDIDPYQQYPEMDGVASPGSSDDYARGNHVHPTDTSRAAASEITRIDVALATKADQASIQQTIEDTVDDWLTAQAPSIGTLSYAAKQALLACFRKVAWIDNQGQSYYNALESELFPDATLESITAVFTQGSAVIYDTDSLDTLKQYLVVTATFSDSTTATVTDYTLSGTLTAGTSTITASYGGKTDTFNVTVTEAPWLYRLENGVMNNGSIDTGIKLLDTDKDITIAFDVNVTSFNSNYRFVDELEHVSPYHGINIGRYSTQNYLNFRYFENYKKGSASFSGTGRLRLVATHSAGSGSMTAKYRIGTSTTIYTDTVSGTYRSIEDPVRIGGLYENQSWSGTINSFYLYDRVFTSTEINNYLGV